MESRFKMRRLLLLGIFLLGLQAAGWGQTVTLNFTQTELQEVLLSIKEQTGYGLVFSDQTLDVDRKVSISVQDMALADALSTLLKDEDVTFEIRDKKIYFIPKPQQTASGQPHRITGSIKDSNGQPVIGATVMQQGTNNGSITDLNGNFSLTVPNGAIIEVSYIGYVSQQIRISSNKPLSIVMREDNEMLEEVVVVGYGVQKKKLVTGANLQVKGDDIQKRNSQNALDALVGQSPGVQIISSSGQPGEDMRVNIRGLGTVGDATPLYVVDGVQTESISYLNPSEIESIDVLKDAASAAIYGARAANGVIIITTKSGKPGKAKISYDGYVGIQNIPNPVEMLNAQEYAMIQNEAAVNSGKAAYDWSNEFGIDLQAIGKGTNWLKELTQKNALVQNHVLSANGGTEQSVYALSLSLSTQEGVIGGADFSKNDRYTFRINTDHKIWKDIIRVGQHASFSYSQRKGISTADQYNNLIATALRTSPFLPVYNADGTYHEALSWYPEESNPLGSLDYKNQNSTETNRFLGDVFIEIQPIKGLKYKSVFGLDFMNYTYRKYLPEYQLSATDMNQMDYVEQEAQKVYSFSWENTLSYDWKLKEHTFNFLLGMQARRTGGSNIYAQKKDLTFNDFEHAWLSNATNTETGQVTATGAPVDRDNLLSYFGRISYDYKETYIFNATLRADASSRFGSGHRWGYFPSFSAGWVITNESFMESTRNWLDFFKLRLSWGQNGNQNITAYSYLATIMSDAYYEFGTSDNTNTQYVGSYQNRMPNPDIKWETSEQFDVGFDARFFNGRLNAAFDYYNKTTKDWLIQVPVPAIYGVATNPYINGGKVRNNGVELGLSYNDHVGELNYSINGNIAYNKNKVLEIPNSEGIIHGAQDVLFKGMQEMNRAQEGYPIGYFWGLDMAGIFQNQAEIDNYKNKDGIVIQPDAQPGDVKFVDHNGDGKIDMNDNIDLGNPYPDITMGFSFSLGWKGFDFFFSSNGSFGQQVAQAYRPIDRFQYNYPKKILDRWTGEGSTNSLPRVTQGDEPNGNWLYCSQLYIEDADFWRINNITLGYDFNRLINNSPLGKLRLYMTVQNLATITKYSGMDPEVGYTNSSSPWGSGIDLGFYPRPRTILFGLNVEF